ncbi:Imidazolonepropionase [hydrothermal vent metagenome]|uniref:imidazolonepropionase n=1 Tax=hydrothermal vent metagenome TaxID=652676 RepID=A0A3B0SCB5_9ZZZZ
MPKPNENQIRVWKDVTLLTMTEGDLPYGLIADGAIAAQNGRIVWLGNLRDMPEYADDAEVISCEGHYMTPGLIDCHTHLVYGGNRVAEFEKRLGGMSYADIAREGGGILSTVRATRQADEALLYHSAQKRLAQLQKGGVTTIEIKSGYGLDLENELKMLKVARKLGQGSTIDVVTSFLGAHATPPEFEGDTDGYLDYVISDMLDAVVKENLADAVDGFCENIAFSPDQIERLFIRARELGLPVRLHAEQLSDSGGAQLAAEYRALSADHLEYITEDGVRAMAASDTVAVLLPGAFYTLRDDHLPPVDLFRKHGVAMAVASDSNPGSSPVLSLPLMINMASTLFRLTPEEALLGVTRHGARALDLPDRGVLEVGRKADFALWDISHPAELAYQVGGNLCKGLVKDGVVISSNV